MKKWIPCNIVRPIEIKSLYTAFEIAFDNKFSFDGESHNFYEIVCVVDGVVGIAAGRDVYRVPGGNLVIHRPMEFHRIWSEDQATPRIIIISFDADILPEVTSVIYRLSDAEVCIIGDIYRKISQSCEINARRVTRVFPDGHACLQVAVNNLENLLLRILSGSASRPAAEISSTERAMKYRDIMQYLNDNVHRQLCINDVAHACGMSVSGAKQVFRRYTGQGIMQYFRDIKAKEAITMLNSGMSVKETALRLGFADQNYFSTFFKKMTGKSPRAYISG